jgi:hypothetical protein
MCAVRSTLFAVLDKQAASPQEKRTAKKAFAVRPIESARQTF